MGRYLGSSCKFCRREGMKLMLKGTRCETGKCAVERRERHMAPGMHGWRRGRHSDYGVRLREKQKLKRYYGLMDKQFLMYFQKAERMRGNTGSNLLELLELRYDNVIYKLNFASSRKSARQLISHGHVHVNGRKVDIPDITMRVGDRIGNATLVGIKNDAAIFRVVLFGEVHMHTLKLEFEEEML